ncbi:NapC/NirT family cytochrome c [bacterium]|nr:NapC/NirT family cytochrome c [bacterium]
MSQSREETQKPVIPPIGPVGRRLLALLHFARRAWWKLLIGAVVAFALLVGAMEYVTSRPAFCGSCHNVMAPYYDSWKRDIHSDEGVICVDCHYAPGQQHTIGSKLKGITQMFQYAIGAFGSGRLRGHVPSESCMTAECHPAGSFEKKEYAFPKPVPASDGETAAPKHSLRPFTHEKHLGKLPNGQELQCATCHEHRAGENHMATSREACYLCHFNKQMFNTDKARCQMCHDLPTAPIQRSGDAPITHQMLLDRKIACASCHHDVVRGGGPVYKERCRACHDQPGLLAEWELVEACRQSRQ